MPLPIAWLAEILSRGQGGRQLQALGVWGPGSLTAPQDCFVLVTILGFPHGELTGAMEETIPNVCNNIMVNHYDGYK